MLPWLSRRIRSVGAEKTRSVRRFLPALEALEIRCLLDIKGLPILHSLPGAPTAVYLDFNGGRSHGSTYAPYDEDGDPTSFNPTEQAHITEAWRQVAVYFAMFDTDVTTQQPTVPFAWELISNSVGGGYSYVNVFPNGQPESFVASMFARTRQSALAHELGHNFGLWHQSDYDLMGNKIREYSSGYDALHGPIMGVDYAGLVHKWFIGHFTNSASELQADVEMIAAQIRRFERPGGDGFRLHENGGTIDTAVPMAFSGTVQSASGIIERLTDKDAYSFTSSGGTYGISAVPTLPSGLAAKLEIYGSDGSLLATSDGPNNDQELVLSLPAGTYYAIVSSHGDYGDAGAYDLTVSTLPSGWATQNIGFVGYAGSAGYDPTSDGFTVAGSGRDIWGSSDDFRYVYQRLNGDGSIVARVAALDPTDPWAKAGVMVRDSLAANAKNALMLVSSANGTSFQYRTATGGDSASRSTGGPRAPYWVELVRSGNTLTGYRSSDGVNWTQQGSIDVSMNSSLYIGLAVTSHNNTVLNNAAFDNVTLTGDLGDPDPDYNGLPAPTGLTPSLGIGTGIDLSWDAVDGASGYAVERSANGVNWTRIGTTTAGITSYNDSGLAGSFRYFYRVSALDDTGNSLPSDVAYLSNRPSAPFNVTVTSWMPDKLILNWRDVSGDTGYRIERSLDGVNFAPVGAVGTNVPSFTDRGLTAGTLYYYRIYALSPDGDSPSSAIASGRTRGSQAPQGGQPSPVLLLAIPSEENVSVLGSTAAIVAEPVVLSLEGDLWARPWAGIAEGLVETGNASHGSARIAAIFSERSEFGQARVARSVSLTLEAHRLVADRIFQVLE